MDTGKKANLLREKEMAESAESNQKTSEHNKWMKVLTVCIVILTAVMVFFPTGRYAMTTVGDHIRVIDTRTGKVWIRYDNATVELGTHKKPSYKWTDIER